MMKQRLFWLIWKVYVHLSSSSSPSAFCFCAGSTAAERSDVVQVWAVGCGLLPRPPVTAPQHGRGAPDSGAGRSEASQVPPGPNGCPPLWACAALPPDPLPPPVSWGHCEALCPNYYRLLHRKKAVWGGTGTGKEAKETINLLQSILDPG